MKPSISNIRVETYPYPDVDHEEAFLTLEFEEGILKRGHISTNTFSIPLEPRQYRILSWLFDSSRGQNLFADLVMARKEVEGVANTLLDHERWSHLKDALDRLDTVIAWLDVGEAEEP